MVGKRNKVFVALSGGVDSSTAAALLLEAGFDCACVFMITSDHSIGAQASAEKIARRLGIKLYVLDLRKDFERVIDYFCSEYRKGRTPNPCVFCNRYIKFGKLWDFAQASGADFLSTGHYARILDARPFSVGLRRMKCSMPDARKREESGIGNDKVGLYEAADTAKDQSYVLAMIDKDILPYIILPIGEYSKEQVREMASEFGLGGEERQESQEICFIPNDDYASVLEEQCPELVRKGNIVNSSGEILAEHNGVHRFTIGQRRGLRVAAGKPYYVAKIDAESNTVTLGPKEEVMHRTLLAAGVNWLNCEPRSPFRAKVKIRYNDKGASGMVLPQGSRVIVRFDERNLAITPGQLAVFYVQEKNGSRIVGGGWIEKAAD